MEEYPSIGGSNKAPHQECIAFYKYDGSNLRFEWTKKQGWHKFGTRTRLFDASDEVFGKAIFIFLADLAPKLEKIFKECYRDIPKITVFCEFFGSRSFAGIHHPNDIHKLVLLDVKLYKKGFISPREFVNVFCEELPENLVAQVIYEGILNKEFIEDVRIGKYPVYEGVVCKGGSGHKLWRCKIKTNRYKSDLICRFENWQDFWE